MLMLYVLCNGRRLRCRSFSITAAPSATARFLCLCVPSELPPLWVPVLRPALFSGPLLLSILNYRTAKLPSHSSPVLETAAKEGGVPLRGGVTNWRFGLGERREGL